MVYLKNNQCPWIIYYAAESQKHCVYSIHVILETRKVSKGRHSPSLTLRVIISHVTNTVFHKVDRDKILSLLIPLLLSSGSGFSFAAEAISKPKIALSSNHVHRHK